jgi:peptidyl-tRNA hydrolase, PTH1 family
MKIIVGLGNPDKKYDDTRHNVGRVVVERFVGDASLCKNEPARFARTCRCDVEGTSVLAVLPLVYMNESGKAVRAIIDFYQLNPADILVVHDDIDIDLGEIRFSHNASSGGNRGVESIINAVGSQNFSRLRIGVSGPTRAQHDAAKYVLQKPPRNEEIILEGALQRAVDALGDFYLYNNIAFVMNRYNRHGLRTEESH